MLNSLKLYGKKMVKWNFSRFPNSIVKTKREQPSRKLGFNYIVFDIQLLVGNSLFFNNDRFFSSTLVHRHLRKGTFKHTEGHDLPKLGPKCNIYLDGILKVAPHKSEITLIGHG